jgi:GxxExxY protein
MEMTDELTGRVIECVIRVHQTLGAGFLEKVYRRALLVEFRRRGMRAREEVEYVVIYEGHVVGRHFLDLVVEEEVIVELKTVEALSRAHYAQVRSYLKASGLPKALLINLSGFRADIRRVEPVRAPPAGGAGGTEMVGMQRDGGNPDGGEGGSADAQRLS